MSEQVELHVGDSVPDVSGAITGGALFRTTDHAGRWLVIYFFPRANTPG